MTRAILFLFAIAVTMVSSEAARAEVQISGTFTATDRCEATKKLRSDNPGNIHLSPGVEYTVIAKNQADATHYWVIFPDAPVTNRRWVSIDCGTLAAASVIKPSGPDPDPLTDTIENLLAASWQPGFCATSQGRNKPECRSQTADRPDATQFSIHGLWPDDLDDTSIFPCYCGDGEPVSCGGSQSSDAVPDLSRDVRAALDIRMPGTQSGLQNHEWAKHGTCYEAFLSDDDQGASADEYFSETMLVLDQLNASEVRELFIEHLGEQLEFVEVQAAFDRAFGPGAGERVTMNCNSGVITELWIGLGDPIASHSDLATLIQSAPTTASSSTRNSCTRGLVVEVR